MGSLKEAVHPASLTLQHLRLSGHSDGVAALSVGLDRRVGVHRVPVQARGQLQVRSQRLFPRDHLARLGGHASEDARHGGVGAPFGLVAGLVLADRFEQQVVLNLIRIATRPVVLPDQIRGCLLVAFVDSRFRDSFAENG